MITTKTLTEVEQEVDLFIYTRLIEMEFGSVSQDQMCIKLKEEFDLDVSYERLSREYNPTIEEMEEDRRLIYKHCAV